jgi:N-acetylmuramoyl-L-alanine amidase
VHPGGAARKCARSRGDRGTPLVFGRCHPRRGRSHGDFHYRWDRLHNPERIYFDIVDARYALGGRYRAEDVTDPVVKRIRVAETNPGTTRVVIDLAGEIHVTTTQLANPGRLMIELRSASAPAAMTLTRLSVPDRETTKPDLPKPPPTIRAVAVAR